MLTTVRNHTEAENSQNDGTVSAVAIAAGPTHHKGDGGAKGVEHGLAAGRDGARVDGVRLDRGLRCSKSRSSWRKVGSSGQGASAYANHNLSAA